MAALAFLEGSNWNLRSGTGARSIGQSGLNMNVQSCLHLTRFFRCLSQEIQIFQQGLNDSSDFSCHSMSLDCDTVVFTLDTENSEWSRQPHAQTDMKPQQCSSSHLTIEHGKDPN